ncbi:MAG TPA: glycerol-3-phosphate 1-O-acyltransferase PlsY [Bryobacteraceae bacterium]
MSSPYLLSRAVLTVLAYFIGGLPFGYWFVRLRLGKDIRTMGSGNIGATNVHRTAGSKAGVIVLLLDIFKGLLAVWIASVSTHGDTITVALAAAAVTLGHCYPAFLRFKGGKAVACFIGAFGFIAPLALVAAAAIFLVAVWMSRYISLGSILGAAVFPVLFYAIYHPALPILAASIFSAVLIIYRHRANIVRLRAGTENVFSLRKKAA